MVELFLAFIIFAGLSLFMVLINSLLGPRKRNLAKDKPFECGCPYLQTGIPAVRIPFALVALLFIAFDVEVVFFFPLALIFKEARLEAFLAIVVFTAILAVAFVYAWKKGVFDWS